MRREQFDPEKETMMGMWRFNAKLVAVVIACGAVMAVGEYLVAQSIDVDKEAYLRSQTGRVATRPTTSSQSPFDTDFRLAVGQRQTAFSAGRKVMPIMNSELTDTPTDIGWRGGGRSINPSMSVPSYTVPAGGFDSPLWASAWGITAYLPISAQVGGGFSEGSLVGTNRVYRSPSHTPIELPTGFWSDLGGTGSPGFTLGTSGPGGYREPFITETMFYNNVGIDVKRQSYSFSYGYNHTNDFILYRHVLNATGDVDVERDGTFEEFGAVVKNFVIMTTYDFDIPTGLDPNSNAIAENRGGDDKTPTGFFEQTMPRASPVDLPNSGRYNVAPYGPRVYSGLVTMFDEDDASVAGVDDYVWSHLRNNFNPLHVGEASLLVLEGNGTGNGNLGDMASPIQKTVWGGPSVGMFQMHGWRQGDLVGVFNTYATTMSPYLKSYPGDAAVGDILNQPQDLNPNPDFFTGGTALNSNTDVSTWTPKVEVGILTPLWGDPRNLTTRTGGGSGLAAANGRIPGQYDHLTLFDLDNSPLSPIMMDPFDGSDRKEITSATGCDRNALGWGPFTLAADDAMTVWQVDLVGAGMDGTYDVYQRALDVWMQRKYNPANDTFYWDGSNDRIIPTYDGDGNITGSTTVNLGRGANSGAVFFPPPPPTLSVFATSHGTIMLAWEDNAETAIDPGTGTVDFSKYRVYRASGYADQFPTVTTAHPLGYNSTIIPSSMGLSDGATPITDVTGPIAATVKASHPYARFIHEGNVIGADYLIGGVYDFVTATVSKFAAANFAGPYVQIAEFPAGGGANMFDPPETVTVPNPLTSQDRFEPFPDDTIETIPNSRQIVDFNTISKLYRIDAGDAAIPVTFPTDRYSSTPFASVDTVQVDPRLAGKTGYMWEDTSPRFGFEHWYYVAAVDNESAVQRDFDSILMDPNSSQAVISRQVDGLESFYTMNANGTDGRWHGTFPFRGLTVGPQVPGQAVYPIAGQNLTQVILSDTIRLHFVPSDGVRTTVSFLSGAVAGHTVAYDHFGTTPPALAQGYPPFSAPIEYFSLSTTMPPSDSLQAYLTVWYTNAQAASASITDETTLVLSRFNDVDTTWTMMTTDVDTIQNNARAPIDGFSLWALASVTPTGIEDGGRVQNIPLSYTLGQNSPNPFNPSTTIRYTLAGADQVRLIVYNVMGQEVRTLVDARQPAGVYTVMWNGRNDYRRPVGSGVYFYRLTAGTFSASRRMVLVK